MVLKAIPISIELSFSSIRGKHKSISVGVYWANDCELSYCLLIYCLQPTNCC